MDAPAYDGASINIVFVEIKDLCGLETAASGYIAEIEAPERAIAGV